MRKIIAYVLIVVCSSGCIHYRKAYYVSAINGLNNAYTPIPLQSDSLKAAYYVSSLVSTGSANDWGHDNSFSFQANLSGSHNFKHLQAYYGTGFLLGDYEFNRYGPGRDDPTIKSDILNQYAGKKFFGGIGIYGGINAVASFVMGGEVRLGAETSLYKEFGDYLTVRRNLPDSAATFINRNSFYGTLGGHIEAVDKTRYGSFALKFSAGTVIGKSYHHARGLGDYVYFNMSLSPTFGKWTPYFQANFATVAADALFGVNYRLGK